MKAYGKKFLMELSFFFQLEVSIQIFMSSPHNSRDSHLAWTTNFLSLNIRKPFCQKLTPSEP